MVQVLGNAPSESALAITLYGFVLCTLYGAPAALAQTLSAPLALNSSIYGESIYLYNPWSQSIVSPVQNTNQLTLIPWRDYNSTMQWTITLDDTENYLLISAVSPQAAACAAGTTALWSAAVKGEPIITVCDYSAANNFQFEPLPETNNYLLKPISYGTYCVAVLNNAPYLPTSTCDQMGAEVKWQLVTISDSPPSTTTRPTTYPPLPRVVMKSACDSASGSPLASTLWFSYGVGQCLPTNNGSISMTCGAVDLTVNVNYYSDALCKVPASSGTLNFNDIKLISFNLTFPLQQCIPSLNWIGISCGLQPPAVPSPHVGYAMYRTSLQSTYNVHASTCDVFDFQNYNALSTCIPNSAGSFMESCSADGSSVIHTEYSDSACTKNPVVFTWPMNTCADMRGDNVQFVDVFSCNGAT